MSIRKIGIANFRPFSGSHELEIAPLTLLVGPNGSGKSSVLKGLQLLKESVIINQTRNTRNPNGYFHALGALNICHNLHIGNFENWLNRNCNEDDAISFSFPMQFYHCSGNFMIEVSYTKGNTRIKEGQLNKVRIYNSDTNNDILIISEEKVELNIDILWESVLDFCREFCQPINSFIQRVNKKVRLAFAEEIGKIEKAELTNKKIDTCYKLVCQFLTGNGSFGFSPNNLEVSVGERKFVQILTQQEKAEYDLLKSLVRTIKSDDGLYHNGQTLLQLLLLVQPELPLLNYDSAKLAAENLEVGTDGNLMPGSVAGIGIKRYQNQIQAKDLISLSHFLKKTLSEVKDYGVEFDAQLIGDTVIQEVAQLLSFITSPTPTTLAKHELVGRKWFYGRKAEAEILSRHEENGEPFLTAFVQSVITPQEFTEIGFHGNLYALIQKVFLDSILTGIAKLADSLYAMVYLPPYRGVISSLGVAIGQRGDLLSDTLTEIFGSKYDSGEEHDIRDSIRAVCKMLEIADDVNLTLSEDADIVKVSLSKNGLPILLSDIGFGISNFLPALFKLASIRPRVNGGSWVDMYDDFQLIAIEEPEANLHPSLQSKLANMFHSLYRSHGFNFIIETHSEYLIRKLQYLTAKKEIKPEDTVIYYFYPPDDVPPGEKQVKKINIQEDGSLTDDFGTGFFDHADKIAMSIWNMNKSQKN